MKRATGIRAQLSVATAAIVMVIVAVAGVAVAVQIDQQDRAQLDAAMRDRSSHIEGDLDKILRGTEPGLGRVLELRMLLVARAVHLTAITAKGITARYYDRPVAYAYWDGCSTGGRQGMAMSQNFPMFFDGIVAGDPVYDQQALGLSETYGVEAILDVYKNNPSLGAFVVCYGPGPDAVSIARIRAKGLGVYAENDARINAGLGDVDAAVRTYHKTYRYAVYPGVGHGFLRTREKPEVADSAWKAVVGFFRESLER